MSIHKTAVVESGAIIAEDAEIGPYAVIGSQASIGNGSKIGPHTVLSGKVSIGTDTKIGPHVVIEGITSIGNNCQIFSGASIGQAPQSINYKDEPTQVKIGNNVTIREYVTVHRGTAYNGTTYGTTLVGDDCYIMNYAHIAHDCQLGKGVIMANSATLAGHITVGDDTVMAGACVFHQFVRIGRLCMVSGMTGSRMDLPPFVILDGIPPAIRGLNVIGMKRHKFPPQTRTAIKAAYKLLYRSGLNFTQALIQIEQDEVTSEVQEIIDFFRSSKRGVMGAYHEESHIDAESDKPILAQEAVKV